MFSHSRSRLKNSRPRRAALGARAVSVVTLISISFLTQGTLTASSTELVSPPSGNLTDPNNIEWDPGAGTGLTFEGRSIAGVGINVDRLRTANPTADIPASPFNGGITYFAGRELGGGPYLSDYIAYCIDPFHVNYNWGPGNDYYDLAQYVGPDAADKIYAYYNAGWQLAYNQGTRLGTSGAQPFSVPEAQNSEQSVKYLAAAILKTWVLYGQNNTSNPIPDFNVGDLSPEWAGGEAVDLSVEYAALDTMFTQYITPPENANMAHTLAVGQSISLTGVNIADFNASINTVKSTPNYQDYVSVEANASGITITQTAASPEPIMLVFDKYFTHTLGNKNLHAQQSLLRTTVADQSKILIGTAARPVEFWVSLLSETPEPGFILTKESSPPSGTLVRPGEPIVYTIHGTNIGDTRLDPVNIRDDLSNALNNATLTGTPTSTIQPAPVLDGTTLTWTGVLEPGQSVQISYTITLHDDLPPQQCVANRVTGEATPPPPDTPITPPPEETEHCTPPNPDEPGFTLTKTSDPISGTLVNPGDKITYTLTGTNTGSTVLFPVNITDDLSKVLNNATLTTDPQATVTNSPSVFGILTLEGYQLHWIGELLAGQSVHITYTITLNTPLEPGTCVANMVTGDATPPSPDIPITPPPVDTQHCTPPTTTPPGFKLTKTSVPPSGTVLNPGDNITYTVTGTNTGGVRLDPVTITDDLSKVFNHATLVGDPTSSLGSVPTITGTTLTWTGALGIGEDITITYTVKINAKAYGIRIENMATGFAIPEGGNRIDGPVIILHHTTPPYLAPTGFINPTAVIFGTVLVILLGWLLIHMYRIRYARNHLYRPSRHSS